MKPEARLQYEALADSIYNRLPMYKNLLYQNGHNIPNPAPRPSLDNFYAQGLLRKEQLEHGKYYLGSCRNAAVARWDANRQMFRHIRHKFGDAFEEDIEHPADDTGFDVFTCVAKIEPTAEEEVEGGFTKAL